MTRNRAVWLVALAVGAGMAFLATPRARAQEPRGKAVYERYCVECHGGAGRGDGASAAFLVPRPRDFTIAKYKIRTTETGSVPTDDDLIASVKRGLYGTAMPGWD